MCDFAVDLDACAANEDFTEAFAALAPLADDGLVRVAGRRIAVTEAGRPSCGSWRRRSMLTWGAARRGIHAPCERHESGLRHLSIVITRVKRVTQ